MVKSRFLRVVMLLVFLTSSIISPITAWAENGKITVSVSSAIGIAGKNVTVTIDISGYAGSGIDKSAGGQLELEYDPELAEIKKPFGISRGSLIPSEHDQFFLEYNPTKESNLMSAAWTGRANPDVGPDWGFHRDGQLLIIEFELKKAGNMQLNLKNVKLMNDNWPVPGYIASDKIELANGTIKILDPSLEQVMNDAIAAIDALPNPEDIIWSDKDEVENARTLLGNALGLGVPLDAFTNIDRLYSAETKIMDLENKFFSFNPVTRADTPQIMLQLTLNASGGMDDGRFLAQIWAEDFTTDYQDYIGWRLIKDYTTPFTDGDTIQWVPRRNALKENHKVYIRIKDQLTDRVTERTVAATLMDLGIARINDIEFGTDYEGIGVKGRNMTIRVAADGGADIQYQLKVNDGSGWELLSEYSPIDTFTWNPPKGTKYQVLATVRSGDGPPTHEMIKEIIILDTEHEYPELDDMEVTGNTMVGQTNELKALIPEHLKDREDLEYRFTAGEAMRYSTVLKDYDYMRSHDWTPAASGVYYVVAYAREEAGLSYEDRIEKYIRISDPLVGDVRITDVIRSHTETTQPVNTTITFAASAEGANPEQLEYAFWRYDERGYRLVKDYSPDNTFTWTPVRPGVYTILVRVRHTTSGSYEDAKSFTYTITDVGQPEITINSFDIDGNYLARHNQKLIANVSGAEDLLYQFEFTKDKYGWSMIRPYSPENSCNWIPKKAGVYNLVVRVMDSKSGSYLQSKTMQVTIN